MPFGETKVYFDGSHYIAIPHTTRPTKKRPKPIEKNIIVCENGRYGIDLEKIIECGDKDLQISIIEFLYGTCKIENLCFLQYFKKSKFPEVRVKITEYAGELTLTEM